MAADIQGDTKERDFRFVADCNQERCSGMFAEDAIIAVLGVEFDAEFTKAFLRGVEKSIMDQESISAVFHEAFLLLVLGRLRSCSRGCL